LLIPFIDSLQRHKILLALVHKYLRSDALLPMPAFHNIFLDLELATYLLVLSIIDGGYRVRIMSVDE
jgi:hypothetical protein